MSPLRWYESFLSALAVSFLFREQGPERKKQQGRGAQRTETSELTLAVPPGASLSPHREFSPILFPHQDQHHCSCERSGLIRWKQWWRDGRQPAIGRFRCGGAVGLVSWSPPEEPSPSRLDERFLPGRCQAPRQRASPFFPEVHDEIIRSWHAPYSFCLHDSSSSALTSVGGIEEKGYGSLPTLDESVAVHLCPPTAIGWKANAPHPCKSCRTTLAGRA